MSLWGSFSKKKFSKKILNLRTIDYYCVMSNIKFKSIDQDQVLSLHSQGYSLKDISVKLSTTEYLVNKILNLHGLQGISNGCKIDRLRTNIKILLVHTKITINYL
jgi:hypothetical protein